MHANKNGKLSVSMTPTRLNGSMGGIGGGAVDMLLWRVFDYREKESEGVPFQVMNYKNV